MENLMKFLNASVPCWVLMIIVFSILFLSFCFVVAESLSRLPENKRLKNLRSARKRILERLVKRTLDEMNDIWKLRSKAFNILWGAYSEVRVFVYATVKVKKDTAYVKFYVGASETEKAKWAPEYVYEIPLQGAEYWSDSDKDEIVGDMELEYSNLLRRYL